MMSHRWVISMPHNQPHLGEKQTGDRKKPQKEWEILGAVVWPLGYLQLNLCAHENVWLQKEGKMTTVKLDTMSTIANIYEWNVS